MLRHGLSAFRREHEGTGYRLIEGEDVGTASRMISEGMGLPTLFTVLGISLALAVAYFGGRWALRAHREWRDLQAPPDYEPPPAPPAVRGVKVEEDLPPPPPGNVRTKSRFRDL